MPFVLLKLGDNTCEYIPKNVIRKSDHVTLNTNLKVVINLIVYIDGSTNGVGMVGWSI